MGRGQIWLGDESDPDASLIPNEEERRRMGRRKFGWDLVDFTTVNGRFSKAMGESLNQSWPTLGCFAFLSFFFLSYF